MFGQRLVRYAGQGFFYGRNGFIKGGQDIIERLEDRWRVPAPVARTHIEFVGRQNRESPFEGYRIMACRCLFGSSFLGHSGEVSKVRR